MDSELEKLCDKLYKLACEVNSELYYLYDGSMESMYQDALASEMRKKKYVYHTETVIDLHYKDFPVKDSEADFVIMPGGPNKFEENVIMEVKHPTSSNFPKVRLQLFTYLYSGPTNNNPMVKELQYGIALVWPTQSTPTLSEDGRFAELKVPIPKPILELWKTVDKNKRTKFELLKTWS